MNCPFCDLIGRFTDRSVTKDNRFTYLSTELYLTCLVCFYQLSFNDHAFWNWSKDDDDGFSVSFYEDTLSGLLKAKGLNKYMINALTNINSFFTWRI